MKLIDLTGKIFGRLTIKGRDCTRSDGGVRWLCECECGKTVSVASRELNSGQTRSCGCLARELSKLRNTTHGLSDSPEYGIWSAMKTRCTNQNTKNYDSYGGRGITISDRWLNSFENFYADMGPRPSAEHSIDRIENDKGYVPGNCRWATLVEQANNKRTTRLHDLNGELLTVREIVNKTGLPRSTVMNRLYSDEIKRPVDSKPREVKRYYYDGQTLTLSEWSKFTGISYRVLHARISKGWSIMDALTIPTDRSTGYRK